MYIMGMGNEEMEKSQEKGRGGKDMLNGVGGLNAWWSLVVHPDESRKESPLEEKKWNNDDRKEGKFSFCDEAVKKKKAGTADLNVL